jgi:hypothetical protein
VPSDKRIFANKIKQNATFKRESRKVEKGQAKSNNGDSL